MTTEAQTTGGPAYPGQHTYIDGMPASYEGMTLRDHFAAHALAALIAVNEKVTTGKRFPFSVGLKNTAQMAYEVADAMLAHKFATDPKPRDLGDDLPF